MRPILHLLKCLFLLAFLGGTAFAQADFGAPPPGPNQVFKLSVARKADGEVKLHWEIAPGNYLYRDSIKATLGNQSLPLELPKGARKNDPNFGDLEVYHNAIDATANSPATGSMQVTYRGCAEAGICYPPISRSIDLATLAITAERHLPAVETPAVAGNPPVAPPADNAQAALGGNGLTMAAAFLGFGLLLAFTPCVFPMIPILSAMLAGAGGRLTAMRGLALSSAYVVAMAAAYGAVGLAAGYSGANLQVILQTPTALAISAAVFVVLALSMFGLFEISLPSGLASRLSRQRGGGSIAGAAALGFGSALIVSPCVTPPLAAAVVYSVTSGDAWRGAAALFFLGLGMGLPVMVFGTLGPRFLPRSGAWLERVKGAFGFVFLAIAVMLVTRLVPAREALAVWGALAVAMGVFAGAFDRVNRASAWTGRLSKSFGLVAVLYGAMLMAGYAGGATDPLRPLAFLASTSASDQPEQKIEARITTTEAFDRAVARFGEAGKPILVSFTADWCTVCKSNEAILAQPSVNRLLNQVPMIVADVTAQSAAERTLMTRFSIVGPPTMFIVDSHGREQPGSRLIGPVSVEDITRRLKDAGI